jgi:hypothetical protein
LQAIVRNLHGKRTLAGTTRDFSMKKIVLIAAVTLGLGIPVGAAEAQSRPGGCLKYGLGGAVAGHFAGGHRLKGALAGCALGIYQRRKYEREARQQDDIRNRNAERGRSNRQEQANRNENRDRSANRSPLPRSEGTNRYEDLGLDLDRGRRTSRDRDGYEQGGSFARGQSDSRNRLSPQERSRAPGRSPGYEPEETGSFPVAPGKVY